MNTVYIILISLHLLFSIIYAAESCYEEDGGPSIQKALLNFVITLLLPVFGFLFLWFSDFYENKAKQHHNRDDEFLFEQEVSLDLLKTIDYEEEINKVPMVEALQMGDYSFRRKMVVDTLREDDTLEYVGMLKEALLNEDTETSHYASSVIMDLQGKLQSDLSQKEELFQAEPENLSAAYAYEEELYKVIKSNVYDSRNLKKYYAKYKSVSDQLLGSAAPEESCYHNRIEIDVDTHDLEHAKKICDAYADAYPESEEMVADNLKLCIRLQDRARMDNFLARLKEMPVLLTAHSLQYVRFFEQKARTEE